MAAYRYRSDAVAVNNPVRPCFPPIGVPARTREEGFVIKMPGRAVNRREQFAPETILVAHLDD
jgi:hypothetical protein